MLIKQPQNYGYKSGKVFKKNSGSKRQERLQYCKEENFQAGTKNLLMEVRKMSEKEKSAFEALSANANPLSSAGYESAVLAITASYLAGKEAGKREASQSDTKTGE